MFGMGFSEIIVILVIALIFLGPEKLPDAAKSISKGIRDLRKQTKDLQHQIEADEHIGGAIRDLRGALRGEPERPKTAFPPPGIQVPGEKPKEIPSSNPIPKPEALAGSGSGSDSGSGSGSDTGTGTGTGTVAIAPTVGETADGSDGTTEGLAELVRPASGTVAKGSSESNG